jgi:hypothetical protein
MDVKSTYLNGGLEEEIYMEPLPSFDIPDGMVLKLVKAIYCTKQGGYVWYNNIKATLKEMGYTCTEADHAVFVHFQDGKLSIMALYVNDFIMACNDLEVVLHDKEIQLLIELSQCLAILERLTWYKSNKLSNNLKIICIIVWHLSFWKCINVCDSDLN